MKNFFKVKLDVNFHVLNIMCHCSNGILLMIFSTKSLRIKLSRYLSRYSDYFNLLIGDIL